MDLIRKILDLLDLVLPRSRILKELDSLSPGQFEIKANKSIDRETEISSLFEYRDPLVKELIWRLKFHGDRKRACFMAEIMHDYILAEITEMKLFANFDRPIVLPVPLGPERLAERGFNQCESIAEALGKIDGALNFEVINDLVVKTKDTANQTSLKNKTAREKNLAGCFQIKDQAAVKNRNFIVIDDVYTTGSTIREIVRELKQAGAKKVIGITFAH